MTDWTLVPLKPALRTTWLETRAAMQWTQPGLTAILYSMMNQDGGDSVFWFTPDIKTMAVDGRRIWANPDFLFGLPIRQRIFAGFHEVMHGVLRHCEQLHWHASNDRPVVWQGKSLPFDLKRAMHAMDYVVNAILIAGEVGEYNPDWLYDPAIATSKTTWQEAYHRLAQRDEAQPQSQQQPQQQPGGAGPPPPPGQGPQGPPPPGRPQPQPGGQQPLQPTGTVPPQGGGDPDLEGPQDYHAAPGTSQGKPADDAQTSEIEWKVAVKAAIATGEQAGKLSDVLREVFGEVIETKVTWTDHLQGLLARRLGGGGYDYRKADRRFVMRGIYTAARSGKGCDTIVIGADSSGSIYRVKGLIDSIFGETKGVLEQVKPRQIILIWCDSKIKRVDWIADANDLEVTWREGAVGGGGTKFMPVFDWVADNLDRVDALLYFTDGLNSPSETLHMPDYPVVWGNIGRPGRKYPFGDVVDIPTGEAAR